MMKLFAKEPVFLGKALAATVDVAVIASSLSDGMKAAISVAALAWIGWGERMFSTPTVTAEANEAAAHDLGFDKAVAQVNAYAVATQQDPAMQPRPGD